VGSDVKPEEDRMRPLDAQPGATVIVLDRKRKAVRAGKRRRSFARPLVSLWFAVAVVGLLMIVTELGALALKHGLLGVGVLFALAGAVAWPLAGHWIRRSAPVHPAHNHPSAQPNIR